MAKPLRRVNSKGSVAAAEKSGDFETENFEVDEEIAILSTQIVDQVSDSHAKKWARRHTHVNVVNLAYYSMTLVEECGKGVELTPENKEALALNVMLKIRDKLNRLEVMTKEENREIIRMISNHRDLVKSVFHVVAYVSKHPETIQPPPEEPRRRCGFLCCFGCACFRRAAKEVAEEVDEFIDATNEVADGIARDVEAAQEQAERDAASVDNGGGVSIGLEVQV
jgi:hypothetical protein